MRRTTPLVTTLCAAALSATAHAVGDEAPPFLWSWPNSIAQPIDAAESPDGAFVYVVSDVGQFQTFERDGTYLWSGGPFDPRRIACDRQGNLFITTKSDEVMKYNPDGILLTTWGSTGSGDGQFDKPVGIAVDDQDRVYVVDSGNHRIQRFSTDGAFELAWGQLGNLDGELDNPRDVAVDRVSNSVFVTDRGNIRVQKFGPNGEPQGEWRGQFQKVAGVAVDPTTQNVLVVDADLNTVHCLDQDLQPLSTWGGTGDGPGLFQRAGFCHVLSDGHVLIGDREPTPAMEEFGPRRLTLASHRAVEFPGSSAELSWYGAASGEPFLLFLSELSGVPIVRLLGVFPTDDFGQGTLPIDLPNDPALDGLTVTFFGIAKDEQGRFEASPNESFRIINP